MNTLPTTLPITPNEEFYLSAINHQNQTKNWYCDSGVMMLGNCSNLIENLPANSIDLIVTSPPYAEKRKGVYGGIPADEYADWLFDISVKMMNVLKPSGSLIINIKEGTVNGQKETYVLEYILKMAKQYRWSESFIWNKPNPFPTGSPKRLKDAWEWCLHFTKTPDFQFFPENALIPSQSKFLESDKKRKNKGAHNVTNGSGMNMSKRLAEDMVRPSNVLTNPISSLNLKHCAAYPIGLPNFFIDLMTLPGDKVLDPFMGSGTTAIACVQKARSFIGMEQKEKYYEYAIKRINQAFEDK